MYTVPQFVTFIWFLTHVAAHALQPSPPFVPAKDIGPGYVEPPEAGPATIAGVHYEYVATMERQAQIINGFEKLKVGQTREEVRRLMGPPDRGEPDYPKESNRPLDGWHYVYRIRYRDKNGWNMNDPAVECFFTPEGKLHWAAVQAIPNLHEVGGAGQKWRDEATRAR